MFGKFGKSERPAQPKSDKLDRMGPDYVWGVDDALGAIGSIDNITFEGGKDAREDRGRIAPDLLNYPSTVTPPSNAEGLAAAAALEARMKAKLEEQKAKVIGAAPKNENESAGVEARKAAFALLSKEQQAQYRAYKKMSLEGGPDSEELNTKAEALLKTKMQ